MDIIEFEKRLYFKDNKQCIKEWVMGSDTYYIWKYMYYLRKEERYHQKLEKHKIVAPLLVFYRRKKNKLGRKLGFDIPGGVFKSGVRIFHKGLVVVNPNAQIGSNAIIVGNLCIGNVAGEEKAAHIGDNCMFGWGCSVIGNITITDNCKIGAGALVNKNVEENDAIMVGVPAKNCRRK